MKFPPFVYHRPETIDEALDLLARFGDEAKVLAGGQSLLPLMGFRLSDPAHVVDVNGLDTLTHITRNGSLDIGAVVRHSAAESSELVSTGAPLVVEALGHVGHRAIRHRGTIGGSIAHADPAAELPAVLCALDGEVVATSIRGARTIAADALFRGYFSTALEPDELLTSVRLPVHRRVVGTSFCEFSRRSGDFALVGVASVITIDDRIVTDARVALAGVDAVPVRAHAAEQAMVGQTADDALWGEAAAAAAAAIDPPADVNGSAAYRRHLTHHLVERALRTAARRGAPR